MAHALILSPDTPGKIDESSQHAIPDECHLWLSNQLASMSKDLECPVGRWKGFVVSHRGGWCYGLPHQA